MTDLAAIIDEHQPVSLRLHRWCEACTAERWPCLPYHLAKHALEQSAALEIEKAKVARGMALAKQLRRNGAGDRAIWIEAALTEQVHP